MSNVTVPENVTFEQAIEITQTLMAQIQEKKLSEADIKTAIAQLVQTQNGARGFFVSYLTDPLPWADHPTPSVLEALRTSPEIVSGLLVKNVAMSAAMVVHHHRQNNPEMAQSSQRVTQRSVQLIQQLNLPTLPPLIQQLFESAKTGQGTYQTFLERWKYDQEQRSAMAAALEPLLS